MEKLKVSKEIKEQLDYVTSVSDNKNILRTHTEEGWKNRYVLNQLTLEELCICLYIGYELEESPEQLLLKKYKNVSKNDFGNGVKCGIEFTLYMLNIEIEGINA